MKTTQFFDRHSGGHSKTDWELILIEAPQEEAETIFFNRFGCDPNDVACRCCGPDFSIEEFNSLEEAKEGYHWTRVSKKEKLVVCRKDILPEESEQN